MARFTLDNTFGYEPAGVKLLNKVFDKVVEDLNARAPRTSGADGARDDRIAQAVLDVCYDDHGNVDIRDLAAQVLKRLG
jgi:hypothetical protein